MYIIKMGVTVRNSSKRPTNQGNKKPKLSTGYFIFFTEVDLSKEKLTNPMKSYSIFYDKIALRPISDVAKTIAAKIRRKCLPVMLTWKCTRVLWLVGQALVEARGHGLHRAGSRLSHGDG